LQGGESATSAYDDNKPLQLEVGTRKLSQTGEGGHRSERVSVAGNLTGGRLGQKEKAQKKNEESELGGGESPTRQKHQKKKSTAPRQEKGRQSWRPPHCGALESPTQRKLQKELKPN